MRKRYYFLVIFVLLASCTQPLSSNSALGANSQLQIHDLQGCTHSSPYLGKQVKEISGVVTWKDDQGFYMQDENPDQKVCSSEAIYVFTKTYPNVIPGDLVEVNGRVNEFVATAGADQLTNTEIESDVVKVISTGNPLPAPVIIGTGGRIPPTSIIDDDRLTIFDPENDGIDFYESLEDMRVEIDNALVVGPEDSYKEVEIISGDLAQQNILSSQGALIATAADVNPERIMLEFPDGFSKTANLGARFTSPVIGILTYAYDQYRILETNSPTLQNIKSSAVFLPGLTENNRLRMVTYNTENLDRFNTAKINKIAKQIVISLGSPDILILQEIQDDSGNEDDGTTSAAKTLNAITESIQAAQGPDYAYIDNAPSNNSSGGMQGGNIRTVLLYRTDRGLKLVNTSFDLTNQNLSVFDNSRIPTIAQFSFDNQLLEVIGVHLVSNNANSPLFGSVQPISKPDDNKRQKQAQWLANYSQKLLEDYPNSSVVIGGDFNDTTYSAPLQLLKASSFENLSETVPLNERYSILFEGNASLYDQILVKNPENLQVEQAQVVHLNTWLNEKQQTSDHDPFAVDLVINK